MKRLAPLLALTLFACSRKAPSGEEWAKKTFGEAGVAELRRELVPLGMPVEGKPYAPRPLVVLHYVPVNGVYVDNPPEFHPMNATLPAGMGARSAKEVRTLVIVQKVIDEKLLGSFRFKGRTFHNWKSTPMLLIAIRVRQADGRFKTVYGDVLEGHDESKLLSFLQGLPEAPPAN